MKTTRRILSVVLAVMLAFSCVALTASVSASADDNNVVTYGGASQSSHNYSLTIYSYAGVQSDITASEEYTLNTSGQVTNSSGTTSSPYTVVAGVKYTIYYVNSYVKTTDELSALSSGSDYYTVGTVTTDSNGVAYLYTNTAGWYFAVPDADNDAAYISYAPTAFTVYLPGTATDGSEQKDVTVYPKCVVTGAAVFTKSWTNSATVAVPSTVSELKFKISTSASSPSSTWCTFTQDGTSSIYTLSGSTDTTGTELSVNSTSGKFYINGLTVGTTYYIYETSLTDSTSTYAAKGSDTPITSFSVSEAGAVTYSSGNYDTSSCGTVATSTYTNTTGQLPAVTKKVSNDGTNFSSTDTDVEEVNGKKATWEIVTTLPSNVTSYTVYQIIDNIDTTNLVVVDSSGNTWTDGSSTFADFFTISATGNSSDLVVDTDYTASYSSGKLTISLTAAGIAKFTSGGTITVTFSTKFTDAYYSNSSTNGTYIPNKAIVGFTCDGVTYDSGDPTDSDVDEDYVTSSSDETGTKFEEPDNSEGGTAGTDYPDDPTPANDSSVRAVQFTFTKVVYGTTNTYPAGAKFTLYKTDGGSSLAVSTATTTSSGTITFTGLEKGTYYIEETSTPDGYVALSKTIQLVVTEDNDVLVIASGSDSDSYDQFNTASDYTTGAYVLNSKYYVANVPKTNLPLTGGTGLYLIVGLGLALVAVGGYMFFRKKRTA